MYCQDCKHSSPDGAYLRCRHPKFLYGYEHYGPPEDGTNIENDEGWGMNVGRFFGCIHFEK